MGDSRNALISAFVAGAASAGLLALLLRRGSTAPRRVVTPNPRWTAKQNSFPEHFDPLDASSFTHIDPATMKSMYFFGVSAYVPRPIALVSSRSSKGEVNLAPFSYSGLLAHDPLTIAVGFVTSDRPDKKRDSLAFIDDSGEFVVNLISDWFVEAANHTCAPYDRGTSELEAAGLHTLPSTVVRAPRVAESAVQYECKLSHRYEVKNAKGAVSTTIVFGTVQAVHVANAVLTPGSLEAGKPSVDFEKLRAVSRLGGNDFGLVKEFFAIPRPGKEVNDDGYLPTTGVARL